MKGEARVIPSFIKQINWLPYRLSHKDAKASKKKKKKSGQGQRFVCGNRLRPGILQTEQEARSETEQNIRIRWSGQSQAYHRAKPGWQTKVGNPGGQSQEDNGKHHDSSTQTGTKWGQKGRSPTER